MTNEQLLNDFLSARYSHGQANNLFFENQTLYSYGYHFPLAVIHNMNTILVSSQDTTVITRKHHSLLLRLADFPNIFLVPDVLANCKQEHYENNKAYKAKIIIYRNKSKNAKKQNNKAFYNEQVLKCVQEKRRYCAIFDINNV